MATVTGLEPLIVYLFVYVYVYVYVCICLQNKCDMFTKQYLPFQSVWRQIDCLWNLNEFAEYEVKLTFYKLIVYSSYIS